MDTEDVAVDHFGRDLDVHGVLGQWRQMGGLNTWGVGRAREVGKLGVVGSGPFWKASIAKSFVALPCDSWGDEVVLESIVTGGRLGFYFRIGVSEMVGASTTSIQSPV